MSSEAKPFPCEQCQSVLGFVRRGADRRAKLAVLRAPLLALNDPGRKVLGMLSFVVEELEQGEVVCAVCGARNKWSISERALQELLLRRQNRSFGLEVEHG